MYWPHHPVLAIQLAAPGGGDVVPWRAPRRVIDWIRVTGCALVLFSLGGLWLTGTWDHLLLNTTLHIGCFALVILCHYTLYEVIASSEEEGAAAAAAAE